MNNEAILLIGHGSRESEGNREFLQFTEWVREAIGSKKEVFPAFIELSTPTIEDGFANCVAAGAKRITVVPVILFAAMHVKKDIPEEIAKAHQRYPDLEILYAPPFGLHPLMLDIATDRVKALANGDRLDEAAILFVGRGSSDPEANSDVAKLARLLWERIRPRWMELCFIGVTEPSYPEGIQRCLAFGAKKILVLPYFLFTGTLMKQMKQILAEFEKQHPGIEFRFGEYLGWDRRLVSVLLDRMREAKKAPDIHGKTSESRSDREREFSDYRGGIRFA